VQQRPPEKQQDNDKRNDRNTIGAKLNFEWSSTKAVSNLRKHGILFEDAARVFFDSGRIEIYDGRETTVKTDGL